MVETYCAKTDVELKAGVNVGTLSDAQYTLLINEAEAYLNSVMRRDLITSYAGLDAGKKEILRMAASAHAAIAAITYDQTGYFLGEVTNLLNANYTTLSDAVRLLKEKYTSDFVEEA